MSRAQGPLLIPSAHWVSVLWYSRNGPKVAYGRRIPAREGCVRNRGNGDRMRIWPVSHRPIEAVTARPFE